MRWEREFARNRNLYANRAQTIADYHVIHIRVGYCTLQVKLRRKHYFDFDFFVFANTNATNWDTNGSVLLFRWNFAVVPPHCVCVRMWLARNLWSNLCVYVKSSAIYVSIYSFQFNHKSCVIRQHFVFLLSLLWWKCNFNRRPEGWTLNGSCCESGSGLNSIQFKNGK